MKVVLVRSGRLGGYWVVKMYSREKDRRMWKDMMKIRGIIVRRRWMIGMREGRRKTGRIVGGEQRKGVMEGSGEWVTGGILRMSIYIRIKNLRKIE